MSTRRQYAQEECIFSALSRSEEIALKTQRIFLFRAVLSVRILLVLVVVQFFYPVLICTIYFNKYYFIN